MIFKRLSIIIPVYNEAGTISIILQKIRDVNLINNIEKEIILINDCSVDNTDIQIKRFIVENPGLTINYCFNDVNKGKGASLKKGISLATGEFLIIQDADLEYDPDEYNNLIKPVIAGYADVVYGSRFMGSNPHRILFFWHTVGNKLLTSLTNMFSNLNLIDMETCYKLFNTIMIQSIRLKEKRFGFEPEVTIKMSRIPGIRIYEVGISYFGRGYEDGKKIGYSVIALIGRLNNEKSVTVNVIESFFMGFLTLSVITGFLSIWIPVGTTILLISGFISVLLYFIHYDGIQDRLKEFFSSLVSLSWIEILVLSFIVLFILATAAQKIRWGDTESYHVQAIKWIRNYAVVPGLGNIHGRFAFNSMFFVISGLFTFQIGETLIFPLNGICYIVLLMRLFTLSSKEIRDKSNWKAILYGMTLLTSLLLLIPNINSTSTDVICAVLIIYLFVILFERGNREGQPDLPQLVLINMLVFSSVSFKLSSLFILTALIILLNRDFIKRGILSLILGLIIMTPFIIRNYYLSGYLAYPFPAVDIFNVDWKIPY